MGMTSTTSTTRKTTLGVQPKGMAKRVHFAKSSTPPPLRRTGKENQQDSETEARRKELEQRLTLYRATKQEAKLATSKKREKQLVARFVVNGSRTRPPSTAPSTLPSTAAGPKPPKSVLPVVQGKMVSKTRKPLKNSLEKKPHILTAAPTPTTPAPAPAMPITPAPAIPEESEILTLRKRVLQASEEKLLSGRAKRLGLRGTLGMKRLHERLKQAALEELSPQSAKNFLLEEEEEESPFISKSSSAFL